MRFEDFKSGSWKQQFQYKSFFPAPVNIRSPGGFHFNGGENIRD